MNPQRQISLSYRKTASKALMLSVVVIGILAFFGYSVGKDMALRDNAREAKPFAGKH